MTNAADRGTAPQRGIGPEVKRVSVVGAPHPDTGYIDTLDEFGATVSVAPLYQVQPKVGETWVITKALGPWSFAARLGTVAVASRPVVNMPSNIFHDGALVSLVNALESLGLITVVRS